MFDAWHSHYVRGEAVATNGNNTYSAAVLRQLMHGRMLRGQNKALVCGFDKDTTFVKSALQRMVNICECAKRQILATMFQGSVLRALCSFDLSYWKDIEEWEVGSEDQRALAKETTAMLKHQHETLCKVKSWPFRWQEFLHTKDCSLSAYKFKLVTQIAVSSEDNIASWKAGFFVASTTFVDDTVERRKQSWYNVFKQSTCNNERFLLAAARTQQKCKGPQNHEEVLEAATVLKFFGPKDVYEIVSSRLCGHGKLALEATELAHEYNLTWGDMFQNRWCVVKKCNRPKRAGSEAPATAKVHIQRAATQSLKFLAKRGEKKGRGRKASIVDPTKSVKHFRPGLPVLTDKHRSTIKKVKRQKQPVIEEQILRMRGHSNPFEKFAKTKKDAELKAGVKRKQQALDAKRSKRAVKTVYLTGHFRNCHGNSFVLPRGYSTASNRANADLFLVGNVAGIRSSNHNTLTPQLFGKLVSTKEFFDSPTRALQVQCKPVWKSREFGFHLTAEFIRDSPAASELVKQVCAFPGSKFKLLSKTDFDNWSRSTTRKKKVTNVSSFAEFMSTVGKLSKIDPALSIFS